MKSLRWIRIEIQVKQMTGPVLNTIVEMGQSMHLVNYSSLL